MKYWLMKSEPDVFSIDNLFSMPKKTECWDGVRNYQARNFMRDEMKKGDLVLFYHSNCKEPGIVGVAEVVKEGYPDHTSWNPSSKYFDPKSTKDSPRWFMVDVKFKKKFDHTVSLQILKEDPKFKNMKVVQKGMRLSVQPVDKKDFENVLKLAKVKL